MNPYARLADWVRRDGAAASVLVLDVAGSAPREAGARLDVRRDGRFTGTIGGGALEWKALALAQRAMDRGEARGDVRAFSLGPELAQCCGGRVRLLIESFDAGSLPMLETAAASDAVLTTIAADGAVRRSRIADVSGPAIEPRPDGSFVERLCPERIPVLLFGAGHVGRALALALAPLPVELDWIDPRPDAFPAHVPGTARLHATADPGPVLDRARDGAQVLVMTHSHALDLDVVAAALARPRLGPVGLIGSATKRARFLKRLTERGIAAERLLCPIGLPGIRSKLPAVIAASVAASILIEAERVAAALPRAEAVS